MSGTRVNPGSKGHSVKVRARALEMIEAGWVPYRAAALLAREGIHVAPSTLARWSKPSEHRERAERARKRREWRAKHGRRTLTRVSDDWKLERMCELRDQGLSFEAIGKVAGVWWGEPLSDGQVARRISGKAGKRKYERRKAAA